MHVKTMGWVVGLLCPLLGAGAVWADEGEGKEITGSDVVKQMAGKPECGDAGVTVAFKTGSAELDENAKRRAQRRGHLVEQERGTGRYAFQGYSGYRPVIVEANLVLSEHRAEPSRTTSFLARHRSLCA